MELVSSANAKIEYMDKRNMGTPIHLHFNGQLREEQQLAADAMLRHEIGILSATTAFGKTVVASYLIASRKVNTLILVHSSALLQQWQKSLSEFLVFEDELPKQPKKRGRQKKLSHIGQLGATKNTLNNKHAEQYRGYRYHAICCQRRRGQRVCKGLRYGDC